MLAALDENFTANGTDGGSFTAGTAGGDAYLVTVLIKSLTIGAACLAVLIVCRFVFRLGNRWLKGVEECPYKSRRICGRAVRYNPGRVWAYTALLLSWLFNLGLFTLALCMAVAYGRTFDKSETEVLPSEPLVLKRASVLILHYSSYTTHPKWVPP